MIETKQNTEIKKGNEKITNTTNTITPISSKKHIKEYIEK
jgi:hypothetical protein